MARVLHSERWRARRLHRRPPAPATRPSHTPLRQSVSRGRFLGSRFLRGRGRSRRATSTVRKVSCPLQGGEAHPAAGCAVRHDAAVVDWGLATTKRRRRNSSRCRRRSWGWLGSPGQDVTDVACGTGNAALRAAGCGARVVGIDASARLLEVARKRAHTRGVDIDFREGDLVEVPLTDGAADLVLLRTML
jgi:2-polyprenyl-3-methyl-5-hydroxy-6-metoxy-1,4-benzoquinol methylase